MIVECHGRLHISTYHYAYIQHACVICCDFTYHYAYIQHACVICCDLQICAYMCIIYIYIIYIHMYIIYYIIYICIIYHIYIYVLYIIYISTYICRSMDIFRASNGQGRQSTRWTSRWERSESLAPWEVARAEAPRGPRELWMTTESIINPIKSH